MGSIKLLYIAGFGRSGSTLLERILSQVEGFVAVGEGRHLWDRGFGENQLCSCGEPFLGCSYWAGIVRKAFGSYADIDLKSILALKQRVDRYRYIPEMIWPRLSRPFQARLKRYAQYVADFYRAVHVTTAARVLIDSSKDPSYAYLLAAIPVLDVRFVHLTRDSRGVAYSWTKEVVRPEITGSVAYMPRYSLLKSALTWNINNLSAEFLRVSQRPYLHIRYEDLAGSPQESLHKIFAFLTEEVSQLPEIDSSGSLALDQYHTLSGNPVRFRQTPIKIVEDNQWVDGLNKWQIILLAGLTFPLLWRYGYKLA